MTPISWSAFPRRGFGSDNHAGVHPAMMEALSAANIGHVPAYGTDPITEQAQQVLRQHFGNIDAYFVFNGTAANVLSLRAMTASYHSVICAETAHIHVDECGAPEYFTGCKVITVPSHFGKVKIEDIERRLIRGGDQHFAQPRVLSLTQSTEYGTVYTPEELRALCDFAHAHKLLVHMDGARLVNAAASLGVSLKAITADVGIDVLSLGGTKNGLMMGEAVVFFNRALADNFKFVRKQAMQLPSKTRFIAAQFIAWLQDDLWRTNANHANAMAQVMAAGLEKIPQIKVTQPVEANAVFALFPKSVVKPLRENYFFYVWDETTFEVRLMMSFDTRLEDIEGFLAQLSALCAQNV